MSSIILEVSLLIVVDSVIRIWYRMMKPIALGRAKNSGASQKKVYPFICRQSSKIGPKAYKGLFSHSSVLVTRARHVLCTCYCGGRCTDIIPILTICALILSTKLAQFIQISG